MHKNNIKILQFLGQPHPNENQKESTCREYFGGIVKFLGIILHTSSSSLRPQQLCPSG